MARKTKSTKKINFVVFITLCLLFAAKFCLGQNYSKLYNDFTIIKLILTDSKSHKDMFISEGIYLWNELEPDSLISFLLKNDSLFMEHFTPTDVLFLNKQREAFNRDKWLRKDLKKIISIKKEESLFSSINIKNRKLIKPIIRYSLPLFSKDGCLAIYRKIVIWGFMQDEDCIYVYLKTDIGWKFIKKYTCIES